MGHTVLLSIECVFVPGIGCRPQSFIKGFTLKGQLNYSLLSARGGGKWEDMVGMAMLLLSNAPHHHHRLPLPSLLHPLPASRAPPGWKSSSMETVAAALSGASSICGGASERWW